MLEHTLRTLTQMRLALLVSGAVLVPVLGAGLALLGWHQREDVLSHAQARRELLVQLLLATASHRLDATAAVLQAEAPVAATGQPLPGVPQALPFLRSLAVMDEQGQVLASTQPTDVGQRLPLDWLGPLPGPGREAVLPVMQGRHLGDLAAAAAGNVKDVPQEALMPMARRLPGPAPRWLLAVLAPGYLMEVPKGSESLHLGLVWLAREDGQLLVASGQLPYAMGEPIPPLTSHPVYNPPWGGRTEGSYQGQGLGKEVRLVSFRRDLHRPLVLVVEQRLPEVLADWRQQMTWLALLYGLVAMLVGLSVWALRRSLSGRIQATEALDRAHERVAHSERELHALLQSVQEPIYRTDAEGRITFVNASWQQQAGDLMARQIGRYLPHLAEPADRAALVALFEHPDPGRRVEVGARMEDGSLRRFVVTAVPLQDGERLVGFAGSAVDVTERYRAEQAMQQQLAFTELLLEISPTPVSMFDRGGRYLLVNRAWEEFSGRPRGQVIGQPVGFFLPAAEQRLHEQEDARLLAEGGRISYETQFTLWDGSRHDMQVTKVAVPDAVGGLAGILATLVDVTEFRRAERLIRQARDAAEEASRVKTEFIANVSHELRTPLQSILGFSELGMARSREQPRLTGMFTDIHASGQRMLAMVNDLLDVAKIESPVGTFHLERTDVRELVRTVAHELGPLMARRQLQLRLRLPEAPLAAKVDPLRFQQAVRNVMANAIRFSPEGGVLEVLGERTPQGGIHLCVADQGTGIPDGEQERIFEAFVQSSATTRAGHGGSGGTGLGLAITRKILEIHGGRIHARNGSGGGAEFHLDLPRRGPGTGDAGEPGDTGMSDLGPL